MRLPCLLLIAAAAAVSPARADVLDLAWDARGVFARELQVAPGSFVEACGALAPGTRVAWRFESAGPLDFNIHYHAGREVHYPAKQDRARAADGVLDVAVAEDQCWMWTNAGAATVRLAFSLTRL